MSEICVDLSKINVSHDNNHNWNKTTFLIQQLLISRAHVHIYICMRLSYTYHASDCNCISQYFDLEQIEFGAKLTRARDLDLDFHILLKI